MKRLALSISLVVLTLAVLNGCATTYTMNMAIDEMPPDAPVVDIAVTAESYRFTPNEVRIKAGTRLVLGITSIGSKHEIMIKDFGIHQTIPADKTVTVELYAAAPGEYEFGCHLGLGFHYLSGMKGILIVTE